MPMIILIASIACITPMIPGKHAKHSALCTTRHHPGRRRLREHATVTGTTQMRRENRALTVKSKDRSVDIRFLRQDADIIRQVARRKIVRSINDDVIVLNKLHRVLASKQSYRADRHRTFGLMALIRSLAEFNFLRPTSSVP